MQLTRKVLSLTKAVLTARELMDALVDANIGFTKKEDTETGLWYFWEPEEGTIGFSIGLTDATKWDNNYGSVGMALCAWNPVIPESDRTTANADCTITQFFANGNGSFLPVIDYIKFGNSIIFRGTTTQLAAFQMIYGFIAPSTEDDPWYIIDSSYVHNQHVRSSNVPRPFNNNGMDGSLNLIPSAARVGKYYDGLEARFANNLYIATVRPAVWEYGFCEVDINGKRFLIMNVTNNNACQAPAFDITDYIEEG